MSIAGKKAWKNNPNIGSEAIHSGDFGESFITYLLSKKGVNVVRARNIGFDLFAIDSRGKIFQKNKIIGISVKARISKTYKKFVPTIPIGSKQIKNSMKAWKTDAWIGIVVGNKDGSLRAFVFPFKNLKYLSNGKDAVAVSKLDNPARQRRASGSVIKLFPIK